MQKGSKGGRVQKDDLLRRVSVEKVDTEGQFPRLQVTLDALHVATCYGVAVVTTVARAAQTGNGSGDCVEAGK